MSKTAYKGSNGAITTNSSGFAFTLQDRLPRTSSQGGTIKGNFCSALGGWSLQAGSFWSDSTVYMTSGNYYSQGSTNASGGISDYGSVIGSITAITLYEITTSAGTGGTMSGGGDYESGQTITITATPSSGYVVETLNGVTMDGSTGSKTCTLTVSSDNTVTATFKKYYKVRFHNNPPLPNIDDDYVDQTMMFYGSTYNLKTIAQIRQGGHDWNYYHYGFKEWNTKADGTGTTYSDGVSVSNLTSTAGGTFHLYAQWASCTITYAPNGGSSTPATTYGYGNVTLAGAISRNGYGFRGWKIGSTTYDAGATYNLTGNVTATAQWGAYRVTFKYENGNADTTADGTVTLPTPTLTGYDFQGWWTAASGGTKIGNAGASYSPNADITLYAHWLGKDFEIGYDNLFLYYKWFYSSSRGLTSTPSRATLAQSVWGNNPYIAVSSGSGQNVYTKYGASDAYFNIPVTQNASYTFSCTLTGNAASSEVYWVALNSSYAIIANGSSNYRGMGRSNGATSYKKTFTTPANCAFVQLFFDVHESDQSETFKNIHLCKTSPFGSVTLQNGVVHKTYKYYNGTNANPATTGDAISGNNNANETKIGVLSAPTRTGYTFAGWYKEASYTTEITSNTTRASLGAVDRTIFSKWTANTYTVTLNKNADAATAGTASVTATYDAAMPTSGVTMPTWTGHTFKGYFDTSASSGGTQYYYSTGTSARTWNKTANTTLYARWTANTYTVAFNANGGSGSMAGQSFTYGASQKLTANAFSRTGYTFGGWKTSASGATKDYTDQQTVSNLTAVDGATVTLYAHWTPITINVKFALNDNSHDSHTQGLDGGTVVIGGTTLANNGTIPSVYGAAQEIPAPTRAHCVFKGWRITDFASGAVWGTTSSPSTAVTSGTVAIGATASASVWVKNLHTASGATVTMTALWERVKYTRRLRNGNGSWRWTLNLTCGDIGAQFSPVTLGTRTNSEIPQQDIVVYAGATYHFKLKFVHKYIQNTAWYVPFCVVAETRSGLYAALTRSANEGDFAVFEGDYTVGDDEHAKALDDATMEWNARVNAVLLEVGTNPLGESLTPTMRFAADTGTAVRVEAKETAGSEIVGWSDDGDQGEVTTDGAVATVTVANDPGHSQRTVTVTANYQLSRVNVSAAFHAQTPSAVTAASSGWSVRVGQIVGGTFTEVSDVGYGQSATFKITMPATPAYGFAGWYRAGSSVPLSTEEEFTLVNVTSETTLYARLTATASFSLTDATKGSIAIDDVAVMSTPYTKAVVIGESVKMEAVPDTEGGGFFAGWHEGPNSTPLGPRQPFAATHMLTVLDNCEYCARFTDSAEVFYVAVVSRLAGGAFGTHCTIAANNKSGIQPDESGDENIDRLEDREAYESEMGAGTSPDGGLDSNAAFFQVTGIRRLVVTATDTDPDHDLTRVMIRRMPGGEDVELSRQMSFSSVVNDNYAYILEFGDVTMMTLDVRVVTPAGGSAHGSVHVGNLAYEIAKFDGDHESGKFEVGRTATAIATPDNGYVFSGWYDNSGFTGDPVSTDAVYGFQMASANVTLYAKFERGSFALYKWEGSSTPKRMEWKSKVYELSKPANLTSARVDAQRYPVLRFKSESFSAPDAAATSTVDFHTTGTQIASQTMRRLPTKRPERYFQVGVEHDAEVDAIIIGTSGEGLAT